MSVSSGTSSLFAAVAFCVASAACVSYGVNHKEELKRLVAEYNHPSVPSDGTADGESEASTVPQLSEVEGGDVALDTSGDVTLKAGQGGHFDTEAEVNGRGIEVMVDTGATTVALTYEDAERAGIFLRPSDFTSQVSTANGTAKVAPVDIGSIAIGSITVRNVRGAVAERGKLHRSLLGMSFLGRLSRVEMRSKTLVLHE